MKTPLAHAKVRAFTLLEALALILFIVVFIAWFLPVMTRPKPAFRVRCISNQKQIATGFLLWNSDNEGHFPWEVSTTNNGVMESAYAGDAANAFRSLDLYHLVPQVFVCPSDKDRTISTNVSQLARENVSYFLALDSSTNNFPACVLTGDRDLCANKKPVAPGLFVYSTNAEMSWGRELHYNRSSGAGGNLSFYDGHVQWIPTKDLNRCFAGGTVATNRLAIP